MFFRKVRWRKERKSLRRWSSEYPPFSLFYAIYSASEIISWRVANLILSPQGIERWRGYNIFNKRHLSQCYASPTSYHVFPRMFALSFRLSDRKYWIELDYIMQSSYFRVENVTCHERHDRSNLADSLMSVRLHATSRTLNLHASGLHAMPL